MTAVSVLPPPLTQFADLNGVPYANGNLYCYEPGTFILVETFQDYLGAQPNANPIILDPAGRCSLWASVNVRLVLFDKNNVPIFDQVSSPPAPGAGGGALLAANNLSDVASAATSRSNLGVGTAGTADIGTTGTKVPLLDGANTWAAAQTYQAANTHSGQDSFQAGAKLTLGAADVHEIGWLGIPQTIKSGAYGLLIGDRATEIFNTATSTVTIPANASVAFPVGIFIVLSWDATFTGTVAITSDTLRWPVGNLTGSRTVTGPGFAVIRKVKATEWWVVGGMNVS